MYLSNRRRQGTFLYACLRILEQWQIIAHGIIGTPARSRDFQNSPLRSRKAFKRCLLIRSNPFMSSRTRVKSRTVPGYRDTRPGSCLVLHLHGWGRPSSLLKAVIRSVQAEIEVEAPLWSRQPVSFLVLINRSFVLEVDSQGPVVVLS